MLQLIITAFCGPDHRIIHSHQRYVYSTKPIEPLSFSYLHRSTPMSTISAEWDLLLLTLSQIQSANYSQCMLWGISSRILPI